MRLLYNFSIQLYTVSIALYAAFNDKAKLWINGRKNWKLKLQQFDFKSKEIYWFHCASLGEFEQGRTLIEEIKLNPKNKVLLTFFSPSGYELRKNYKGADWILYLPSDTPAHAQFFIEQINPKAAFFIKYEFWFNHLNELKIRNIPVFLVSGIFRENQHFFKWYGTWASKQLVAFTYFFVQNQQSLQLLHQLGYQNANVTGDTRFDRVFQIMQERKKFETVELFANNALIIVAGSTYWEDEKLLHSAFTKLQQKHKNMKLIIAPHVVSATGINETENLFGKELCVRFSQLNDEVKHKRVLIIDNIGMLSSLYAYAAIAYIGGGLGKGIHNTLEAAVYGIPLLFGNNYHKFDEAKALLEVGAAFVISNETELIHQIEGLITNEDVRTTAGINAANYVTAQKGAVNKILAVLKQKNIVD